MFGAAWGMRHDGGARVLIERCRKMRIASFVVLPVSNAPELNGLNVTNIIK